MALSTAELAPGEKIFCTLNMPEAGEKIQAEGVVKWHTGNGKHYSGIELMEENKLTLPLLKLFGVYCQEKLSFPEPSDSLLHNLSFPQRKLYLEIYWGLLFKTINRPVLSELINLSGEIELKNLYLKKLHPRVQALSPDEEITGNLRELENTLDKSRQALNNIITLFQQLAEEPRPEKQEGLPEAVQINKLCSERIAGFKEKLGTILPDDATRISFEAGKVPLILGRRRQLEEGMDLLLLYCYQFILFFRARKTEVATNRTNNTVVLVLSNDGSKIFEADNIELDYNNPAFLENFNHREQKLLAILYCALDLFQSVRASMSLSNQSGNNQLTLKIPI